MLNSNGLTLWLTGLSGAGKSTLSEALKDTITHLYGKEHQVFLLDGDIVRRGLNKNLGFSKEDRAENIRRIAEVSKLFNLSGQLTVVAFISPYSEDRDMAKKLHEEAGLKFLEVHIATSLELCEERDVKGLYKKARAGEIKNFTGISDPYEEPKHPDLKIDTKGKSVGECVTILLDELYKVKYLIDNRYMRYYKHINKTSDSLNSNTNTNSNNNKDVEEDDETSFNSKTVSLTIEEEELNWLQCIQQGWVPSSIKCFFNENQLLECLYFSQVDNKLQSLPVIFPICSSTNKALEKFIGKDVNLVYENQTVAVIEGVSTYPFNREEFCSKVFGTSSNNHPKTSHKYLNKTHLVTGTGLKFKDNIKYNDGLDDYRLSPEQIQKLIKEKNADCVYAFQLRNPLHNGHCMLLNDTRKKLIADGYKNPILLLHPCGGWTKDDDVPLKPRIEQHKAVISNKTLDENNTILAIWPAPMFYAGPLEVLFHFSSRMLCNVDFMIVGRDPAGIKNPDDKNRDLFDPTHGAKVLNIAHNKGLLGNTTVIPFKVAVYNKEAKGMEYFDPKNKDKYDNISGSKMRELARNNQSLPEGFMDEKGWEVLVNYYKSLN